MIFIKVQKKGKKKTKMWLEKIEYHMLHSCKKKKHMGGQFAPTTTRMHTQKHDTQSTVQTPWAAGNHVGGFKKMF